MKDFQREGEWGRGREEKGVGRKGGEEGKGKKENNVYYRQQSNSLMQNIEQKKFFAYMGKR